METGDNLPESGKKDPKTDNKTDKQLVDLIKSMQQEIADLKAQKGGDFSPENLAKMLATFQAEKQKQEDINYEDGVRADQIPVDDYLEKGVTFSAPSVGMCIVDDRRKGIRVILPFGKKAIMFLHTATRHVKRDKYTELVTMCSYTSHSKAEVEWLREHSLYNVVFYETTKGVIGAEIQNAQRISRIIQALNQRDMPSIVKSCKDYKLGITDDIATMRAALAVKMAAVEAESEESYQSKRLAEINKERDEILGAR